jgi:hypothetical protein
MIPFRSMLSLLVALAGANPATAQDEPRVVVPTFPNATCPIMGKKVSMPLFVDTALGRFYVCCKPCFKKVLADLEGAHKTAYPVVEAIANTTCPVSGEPIGEHAVEVTLQAYRFKVCCDGCVETAKQQHQLVLTKITRPKAEDVGNTTCPVSGDPVAANTFALVDGAIVHFAGKEQIEAAAKKPAETLDAARKIAKAQPPKAKHEHVKKQPKAPAEGKPTEAGK